jgi:hypothetical protein
MRRQRYRNNKSRIDTLGNKAYILDRLKYFFDSVIINENNIDNTLSLFNIISSKDYIFDQKMIDYANILIVIIAGAKKNKTK